MFEKIKSFFSGKKDEEPTKPLPTVEESLKPKKSVKPNNKKELLTPKQVATQNGEPYINIVSVEVDPNNINNGAFELDWNDKFILNLIKSGYKQRSDDTDQIIVDRWFQTVCRNIALEVYEQEIADPNKRDDIRRVINTRDIGNGRTEVS